MHSICKLYHFYKSKTLVHCNFFRLLCVTFTVIFFSLILLKRIREKKITVNVTHNKRKKLQCNLFLRFYITNNNIKIHCQQIVWRHLISYCLLKPSAKLISTKMLITDINTVKSTEKCKPLPRLIKALNLEEN